MYWRRSAIKQVNDWDLNPEICETLEVMRATNRWANWKPIIESWECKGLPPGLRGFSMIFLVLFLFRSFSMANLAKSVGFLLVFIMNFVGLSGILSSTIGEWVRRLWQNPKWAVLSNLLKVCFDNGFRIAGILLDLVGFWIPNLAMFFNNFHLSCAVLFSV